MGFPADKDGLKTLMMHTRVRLSQRDVYFLDVGNIIEDHFILRFQASKEEIDKIVYKLDLIPREYVVVAKYKAYWWKPIVSSHSELYRSDRRPLIDLFYEADTKQAYLVIFE